MSYIIFFVYRRIHRQNFIKVDYVPIHMLLWISRILSSSPKRFKTAFGTQMRGIIKRPFTLGRLLEIPRCIEFGNSRQLLSATRKYRGMEYPHELHISENIFV